MRHLQILLTQGGTCKMRNETKRNETKRNKSKRNSSKRNKIYRNETKSKRFGQFRINLFRFVSVNFASFRWISFRFISFRFVSISLRIFPYPNILKTGILLNKFHKERLKFNSLAWQPQDYNPMLAIHGLNPRPVLAYDCS